MNKIKPIELNELAMPKKINPEAVKAIEKANKDFGFEFAIDQMQKGGVYEYTANSDSNLYGSMVYALYKVNAGWKVVMRPNYNSKAKKATKLNTYIEMIWFKL